MPKPPKFHKTPLRYPKEDHARIVILAEALGVSHGELYRQAITNFLDKKEKEAKWTCFIDLCFDYNKAEYFYKRVYIQAEQKEATIIFFNRFDRDPEEVCKIQECKAPNKAYYSNKDVLIIPFSEITREARNPYFYTHI